MNLVKAITIQGLTMAFKDTIGQVVKLLVTGLTLVTLPCFVSGVFTPFGHLS